MNQQWIQDLDSEARAKAECRIAVLQRFNADEPEQWVASEVKENIPQTARFLFLHRLRQEVVDGNLVFGDFKDDHFDKHLTIDQRYEAGEEAFQRLVQAGVDPCDLIRVARAAVCMSVDHFVTLADRLSSSSLEEMVDIPDWAIVEIAPEIEGGSMTGRRLDGLHESLRSLYTTDEQSPK